MPTTSLMIRWYILSPGWPSLWCQISVLLFPSVSIWYAWIYVTYNPGGVRGNISLICRPSLDMARMWRASICALSLVCMCKLFALISWKLIRFRMAMGAKMANFIRIIVLWGSLTVARPNPSLSCFWPTIMVMSLEDGCTTIKYLLSLRMEWEVPLSMMQLLGSSIRGMSQALIFMWESSEAGCWTYSVRSSFSSRKFPCVSWFASVRLD